MLKSILNRKITAFSEMKNTILDPKISGKSICLNLQKVLGNAVCAGTNQYIQSCKLSHSLRSNLKRSITGSVILPPLTRAFDRLLEAVNAGEKKGIFSAAYKFYTARNRAIQDELDKVVRTRTPHSAMLVGIANYRDDLFSCDGLNILSDLEFNEIGLSARVLSKLRLKDNDLCLFSRYPTTRVLVVRVRLLKDLSDDVVALPVGNIQRSGKQTSLADLIGGDLDGDSYVIRTVHSKATVEELATQYTSFWKDYEPDYTPTSTYSYLDHKEEIVPEQIQCMHKILQKTCIGSLTKDWYAAFRVLDDAKRLGSKTELTFEDIRQMMEMSLESAFDLKHGNSSEPLVLHSLLLGQSKIEDVKEQFESQGLDIGKLERMMEITNGVSIRDAANHNSAYLAYSTGDTQAIERILKNVPEDGDVRDVPDVFNKMLFGMEDKQNA